MSWNFVPNVPVFLQIADGIKRKILSGEYPPDTQLPSVRTIAEDAGVNPNTVQRSLTLLEQMGLVVTRGTVGRFVTDDKIKIGSAFDEEINKELDEFLSRLSVYGVSRDKAVELLKNMGDSQNG